VVNVVAGAELRPSSRRGFIVVRTEVGCRVRHTMRDICRWSQQDARRVHWDDVRRSLASSHFGCRASPLRVRSAAAAGQTICPNYQDKFGTVLANKLQLTCRTLRGRRIGKDAVIVRTSLPFRGGMCDDRSSPPRWDTFRRTSAYQST